MTWSAWPQGFGAAIAWRLAAAGAAGIVVTVGNEKRGSAVQTAYAYNCTRQILSHRPFPYWARPVRHKTDQEENPDHPLLGTAFGFAEGSGCDRQQVPVRTEWP